jgi:tetratricopeptide (TPR) repeat protein
MYLKNQIFGGFPMFRKNYFTFLLVTGLFLMSGLAAFAQTAPVRGKVQMKKADGTTVPVAGAMVEVFRTDVKSKFPSAKTDKRGEFTFAGLPLGATFALSVSAPNANPELFPNLRAGAENVVITLAEGNGQRWTEDEVRQALAGTPTSATSNQPAQPTGDQKKAQEELQKQVADVEARNKRAENATVVINKVLQEGSKAFEAKNYDLAIAKFEEGVNADPDFAGSAPVLLNNKAAALISRATNNYNQSVKADPAARASAMASVKKDFEEAIAATDRSIEILKNATPPDAAAQKNYETNRFQALTSRKEAYRLMTKTGAERNRGKEAAVAFQEYLAAETDAKRKADAQLAFAETLQDSNEFDMAIQEFEKVLGQDPNNVNALAGVGFSLINVGYMNNDKSKMQQGANYLQKFTDLAPDSHQYKADAKGLIETLKKEQSVTPQKVAPTRRKQ